MRHLPLRSVSISNFRRLDGSWVLPLDAPVVLIHGPNGTGKTSVLSAIELALTGEIKSMRRHDDRYAKHLPTHGQTVATIKTEIEISDKTDIRSSEIMVREGRVDGSPALEADAAQFYAERCYLDQVFLGRLLELYQVREGKKETALARFVNELLGLDHLDALRSGLSDTADIRNLRNLCGNYVRAEGNVKQFESLWKELTEELETVKTSCRHLVDTFREKAAALGHEVTDIDTDAGKQEAERLLAKEHFEDDFRIAKQTNQALAELRGRIKALAAQPAALRLRGAQVALDQASAAYKEWHERYGAPITALRQDARAAGLQADDVLRASLDSEVTRIDAQLHRHESSLREIMVASEQSTSLRLALEQVQTDIAEAEGRAGTLAAGLAALRNYVSANTCPVCDRDFSELGTGHLAPHLDQKIAQLTNQGRELQSLNQQRDQVAAQLRDADHRLSSLQIGVLTGEQLGVVNSRREAILSIRSRLDDLSDAIDSGEVLEQSEQLAEREMIDFQAADKEREAIRSELASHASVLGRPPPAPEETLTESGTRLSEYATSTETHLEAQRAAWSDARNLLGALTERTSQLEKLTAKQADAFQRSQLWERIIVEMDRRRAVARTVHKAASDTRAAVVQRVFTDSLNNTWREVFTRLAPREPFVPIFGLPSSTKTALELRFETVHSSGDRSGLPSLMLSTGNLNTAALSLFIALHLAVEPVLPCLVLDDPVQSMDEVHVTQFAGLLRVLSKHHERQVVVAVHERELFDYLALELSPAYEGDELITIELGTSTEDDSGCEITRLDWSPDRAIAV